MEMNPIKHNVELRMERKMLDDIPLFSAPEGFDIHWFQRGDEVSWRKIQDASDKFQVINEELFADQFGYDIQRHTDRICFIKDLSDEILVGVAAAWWQELLDGTNWGKVHWVAILPSHQSLGLSRVLLSEVCRRLRKLGHTKTFLTTSSARIPALNLYRKFGFKPVISSRRDWQTWRTIEPHLKLGLGADFPSVWAND